jgi:hypothetical protein
MLTSLPVWDLGKIQELDFCGRECTSGLHPPARMSVHWHLYQNTDATTYVPSMSGQTGEIVSEQQSYFMTDFTLRNPCS